MAKKKDLTLDDLLTKPVDRRLSSAGGKPRKGFINPLTAWIQKEKAKARLEGRVPLRGAVPAGTPQDYANFTFQASLTSRASTGKGGKE